MSSLARNGVGLIPLNGDLYVCKRRLKCRCCRGVGAIRQMCRREGNDLPEMLVGGCNPALRDADERAQYVWAHDGNEQSCHRRIMISMDRKNVCGFFPSFFHNCLCPHTIINVFLLVFPRCSGFLKRQDFDNMMTRKYYLCTIDRGAVCARWQSWYVSNRHTNEVAIDRQTLCAMND